MLAEFATVTKQFPKLNAPVPKGRTWEISGAIDVIDDEGGYWDTYEVRIVVPELYPKLFPVLYETSNKIDPHVDWHNTEHGCCLSTQAVMYAGLYGKPILINWLEKFAHPFLANHVYRVRTNQYANGEFSHYAPGILEGYYKLFNTTDNKTVVDKLKLISGIKPIGRNSICFCGSGELVKHCYEVDLDLHTMGIPVWLLKKDLQHIVVELRGRRKK